MSFAKLTASTLAIAAVTATTAVAQSRDNVQVAGSSTVLPYASIVAEAFGENFDFPTPVGPKTAIRTAAPAPPRQRRRK